MNEYRAVKPSMAENFLAVNYVRYEKDDSKSARFLITPNPTSPPNPLLLNVYSASASLYLVRGVLFAGPHSEVSLQHV